MIDGPTPFAGIWAGGRRSAIAESPSQEDQMKKILTPDEHR
jgi:hypothetical protein